MTKQLLAILFAGPAFVSCASSPASHVYVAPTAETIAASVEEGGGTTPYQAIYVENRSTVPIHVTSVTLRRCENIKQRCDAPLKLNYAVEPGRRRQVQRVEPDDPNRATNFSYSYAWQADSSSTAALGVLANNGNQGAAEELKAIQQAREEAKSEVGAHYENLMDDDIRRLAATGGRLRTEPDSIVLPPGGKFSIHMLRVLLVNNQGETLGRVYSVGMHMTSSLIRVVPPDTLVGDARGRGGIEIRLNDNVLLPPAKPIPPVVVPIIVR